MNLLHNLLLLIIPDEAALKQSVLYWGVLCTGCTGFSMLRFNLLASYLPLFDCMLHIHGS